VDDVIGERIQERLGPLRGRERVGIGVIAVLVLAGAVLWYVRSLPRPVTISAAGDDRSAAAPATLASPSPSGAVLFVHVAGRVRHPGVYRFLQCDRVIDALEAAGGARAGADLRSINLAALLTDGQQIVVLKKGAPAAGGTAASGSTGSGSDAPVNLNTATLDQLESLPGIGPALGQRIIDYREEHGPFGSVDELDNVSGIGEKTLENLRPLVSV
jgi:competence protein ComEA